MDHTIFYLKLLAIHCIIILCASIRYYLSIFVNQQIISQCDRFIYFPSSASQTTIISLWTWMTNKLSLSSSRVYMRIIWYLICQQISLDLLWHNDKCTHVTWHWFVVGILFYKYNMVQNYSCILKVVKIVVLFIMLFLKKTCHLFYHVIHLSWQKNHI